MDLVAIKYMMILVLLKEIRILVYYKMSLLLVTDWMCFTVSD